MSDSFGDTSENPDKSVGGDSQIPEVPTPNDDEDESDVELHKWHDFESQYCIATQQSTLIVREQWGGQFEFLMSCISSAVGLGNICRFPLVAGQNGGGAFVIPYLIVLCILGKPMYMLELCLGQFCSNGPVKVWEMVPAFRGVGIAATVASFLVASFYVAIMGWTVLYVYYSMFPQFPWDNVIRSSNRLLRNSTSASRDFFELVNLGLPDVPHEETEFRRTKGLDGPPVLNLTIALFVSWLMVWGMMVGGVSGSGKVAYFTALFPYVILIILLGGGLSLDGSGAGLTYFFSPNWEHILLPETWFRAVGQCFFSLGISFGGCIMFSSFNRFNHNLQRDVFIISFMDTFTSILAGACMFSLIGNIAYTTGPKENITQRIEDISKSPGLGLAFETFPDVLSAFGKYPGPNCISALFFFMIILLAVGSVNGLIGGPVTVICDYFPKWKRWIVVSCMCSFSFLVGLVYVCPTGSYVIDIVDKHGSELVICAVAFGEIFGVTVVYGLKNICNDFEFMLGGRVHLYFKVCWAVLPFILIAIFTAYLATYKRDEKWPDAALGCGWGLTITCWLILPFAALTVIQTRKSHFLIKRIKASILPTRKWGPKDKVNRQNWIRWKKTKQPEFQITGRLLTALNLRKPLVNPRVNLTNNAETQTQTTTNFPDPSATVRNPNPSVEVAAENPPSSINHTI